MLRFLCINFPYRKSNQNPHLALAGPFGKVIRLTFDAHVIHPMLQLATPPLQLSTPTITGTIKSLTRTGTSAVSGCYGPNFMP